MSSSKNRIHQATIVRDWKLFAYCQGLEAVELLSGTGSCWTIVRDSRKLLNYCQGLEAVELLSGTGSCWTIVGDWKLLKCSHVMMKRGVFITLFKMHCCYYFKYHLYCARVEILRLALWSGERMYYAISYMFSRLFSFPNLSIVLPSLSFTSRGFIKKQELKSPGFFTRQLLPDCVWFSFNFCFAAHMYKLEKISKQKVEDKSTCTNATLRNSYCETFYNAASKCEKWCSL